MTIPAPDLDVILESIRARVLGDVVGEVAGDITSIAAASETPPLSAKPVRLLPTPLVDASGVTVEALLIGLLEPMLRQWLDAHLPEICERIAQQEIRRLTGQTTTPA